MNAAIRTIHTHSIYVFGLLTDTGSEKKSTVYLHFLFTKLERHAVVDFTTGANLPDRLLTRWHRPVE